MSVRGHNGRDGAVRARIIAVAWDHGTSRAHYPQVHTHVVVPNLAWGDDRQLGTVEGAIGLFARLAEEQGTIALKTNRRQAEAWERTSPSRRVPGALGDRSGSCAPTLRPPPAKRRPPAALAPPAPAAAPTSPARSMRIMPTPLLCRPAAGIPCGCWGFGSVRSAERGD